MNEVAQGFFCIVGIFSTLLWLDKQINRLRDHTIQKLRRRYNQPDEIGP